MVDLREVDKRMMKMADQRLESDTKTTFTIKRENLPLCCPGEKEDGSNLHPRVFLPIEKSGEAVCPYCGKHYKLAD